MKIILLNLFDAFFAGISAFIFFQTILGKKHSKLPYYSVLAIYIAGYISYNALTLHLTGNTSNFATVIRICVSIIFTLILSFLFSSNIRTRVFLSIEYCILGAVFENFSYFITTSIYSYNPIADVMDNFVFSSISMLAALFLFLFSMIIHLIWKRTTFFHSFNYTMILLIIPVLSICLLLSKPILYLNINLPSTYFILAAFVLFINFMNYILLYNVLDTEELRFQLEVQKEQLEFQRNKYKQLGEAYKNIRSFMHDTKKHLFYIESCVNNKKYDDIIPYSREIMHDLESRYCTINTGNLVVDAFVSNLLLQAKSLGIALQTDLKFDKDILPINDYHMTIILGNLLDNALNACKNQLNAKIKVSLRSADDNFSIHVANTYVITSPDKAPEDFESTDFIHGYGLKNVKNSAETCGGFCVIQHENDIYSVTVIVPMSS